MLLYSVKFIESRRGLPLTCLIFAILYVAPADGKRRLLPSVGPQGPGSSSSALPMRNTNVEKLAQRQRTSSHGPSSVPVESQSSNEVISRWRAAHKKSAELSTTSRVLTHSVTALLTVLVAVGLYLRNGLPTMIFVETEEVAELVAPTGDLSSDHSDESTHKYRSLACLVCCWAMCHLSMPSLLLLGNGVKLPLYTDSSSSIDTMSALHLILIALTAVLGGMVYDRWGHAAAVCYGLVIISPLCIIVELLSLGFAPVGIDAALANQIVSLLLPVIIGATLTWHLSAMMTAFSLFARCYVAPLSILLAAGVIEGSSHLDRLIDDEHIHGGDVRSSAGFYGLLALKFATIGLLACLQASTFSSDVQRATRRVLPGKQFVRSSLHNLGSPNVLALVVGQVAPIAFAGASYGHQKVAAAPWEALATLWSVSAWGALLPAYVYLIGPEFCRGLLAAICIAFLGAVSHMDVQFISHGHSAWPQERAGAAFVMFSFTAFILVVDGKERVNETNSGKVTAG